jgi:hypothetical protein
MVSVPASLAMAQGGSVNKGEYVVARSVSDSNRFNGPHWCFGYQLIDSNFPESP